MGQSGGEAKQPSRWRTFGRWAHRGLLVLLTVLGLGLCQLWRASHQSFLRAELPPWTGWQKIVAVRGYLKLTEIRRLRSMDGYEPGGSSTIVLREFETPVLHYKAQASITFEPGPLWSLFRTLSVRMSAIIALLWTWPALRLILRLLRRRKKIARGFEVLRP